MSHICGNSMSESISSLKLLIVEDEPIHQTIAMIELKLLDIAFDIVSNGSEALEAVKSNKYAAILMDCQMPQMDGFEATRQIRSLEASEGVSTPTPIIAVTGLPLHEYQSVIQDCGMDDCISKPISSEVLKRVLDKWLHGINGNCR